MTGFDPNRLLLSPNKREPLHFSTLSSSLRRFPLRDAAVCIPTGVKLLFSPKSRNVEEHWMSKKMLETWGESRKSTVLKRSPAKNKAVTGVHMIVFVPLESPSAGLRARSLNDPCTRPRARTGARGLLRLRSSAGCFAHAAWDFIWGLTTSLPTID